MSKDKNIISKKINPAPPSDKDSRMTKQDNEVITKQQDDVKSEQIDIDKTQAVCFAEMTYPDGKVEKRILGDKNAR